MYTARKEDTSEMFEQNKVEIHEHMENTRGILFWGLVQGSK